MIEEFAALNYASISLTGGGEPEQVQGAGVTSTYSLFSASSRLKAARSPEAEDRRAASA